MKLSKFSKHPEVYECFMGVEDPDAALYCAGRFPEADIEFELIAEPTTIQMHGVDSAGEIWSIGIFFEGDIIAAECYRAYGRRLLRAIKEGRLSDPNDVVAKTGMTVLV